MARARVRCVAGDGVNTVQLYRGSGRQPWFLRLVSPNGEILAVSEGYVTRWGARRAAAKNFAGLKVVEVAK